jgi:hypothetical protein
MEPEAFALFRLSTDRGKNVAMPGRVARMFDRARFVRVPRLAAGRQRRHRHKVVIFMEFFEVAMAVECSRRSDDVSGGHDLITDLPSHRPA